MKIADESIINLLILLILIQYYYLLFQIRIKTKEIFLTIIYQ